MFTEAGAGAAAAVEAHRDLGREAWEDGVDVHRAARIGDAGHGGQMVVSASTAALVAHDLPEDVALRDWAPTNFGT